MSQKLKIANLENRIECLLEELAKRPKLVCYDVKNPERVRLAEIYCIEIETEKGKWIFHAATSTANPRQEVEFIVNETMDGDVSLVATQINEKESED